jgi:hypothetical protein
MGMEPFLVTLLVVSQAATRAVVVVGLGDAAAVAGAVAAARRQQEHAGATVLADERIWQLLTGIPTPRLVDVQGLRQMLDDAAEHEARFDSAGASALRDEVLRAFDLSIRPSAELRVLAARAAFDQVAALVGAGRLVEARERASSAVRRFGNLALDPTRYPPAAASFVAAVRHAHAKLPHGRLRVETDVPSTLVLDGEESDTVATLHERDLSVGAYRLWLCAENGATSLPHALVVGEGETQMRVALELESRLTLTPTFAIDCRTSCPADLRALGARLGAPRILGVSPPGQTGPAGLWVDVATGRSTEWEADVGWAPATAMTRAARPAFSTWSLVPLGGGQFAQRRPAFGGTYLAVELGLGAWHVIAWQRHAESVRRHDFDREPDLRFQRNLSAGLFYGALVAGIIEAVVVGALTGE